MNDVLTNDDWQEVDRRFPALAALRDGIARGLMSPMQRVRALDQVHRWAARYLQALRHDETVRLGVQGEIDRNVSYLLFEADCLRTEHGLPVDVQSIRDSFLVEIPVSHIQSLGTERLREVIDGVTDACGERLRLLLERAEEDFRRTLVRIEGANRRLAFFRATLNRQQNHLCEMCKQHGLPDIDFSSR